MTLKHPTTANPGKPLIDRIKDDVESADRECVRTYSCTRVEFQELRHWVEESPCNSVSSYYRLSHTGSVLPGCPNGPEISVENELASVPEADVDGLGPDGHSKKTPDIALYPMGRPLPTIALEVGYSETYQDLVADATLLLEGSNGSIGLVILVKLQPPPPANQYDILQGFVELHIYDQEAKRRIQYQSRMTLYPPPKDREQQRISLSWQTLLREFKDDGTIVPPTAQPPPLMLEDLRALVDNAVQVRRRRSVPTPASMTTSTIL
ncbi:hypothetical protein PISL3812_09584 [Talaromyces islandicus]|uniref:Uncharacterized protein n=1 Tax=Talaromyces islandicus TaxID=28573 RepID=A0A0U1MA44_TALIS|nr:hypothetical protein PISL3812_09584 [Talaromyces islandicus]